MGPKNFTKKKNQPKDRQKTGAVAYNLAGEFTKQGGSYKTWKSRWFVCDDSKISYFKDKKEWETGPVAGVPKGKKAKRYLFIGFSHLFMFFSSHKKKKK